MAVRFGAAEAVHQRRPGCDPRSASSESSCAVGSNLTEVTVPGNHFLRTRTARMKSVPPSPSGYRQLYDLRSAAGRSPRRSQRPRRPDHQVPRSSAPVSSANVQRTPHSMSSFGRPEHPLGLRSRQRRAGRQDTMRPWSAEAQCRAGIDVGRRTSGRRGHRHGATRTLAPTEEGARTTSGSRDQCRSCARQSSDRSGRRTALRDGVHADPRTQRHPRTRSIHGWMDRWRRCSMDWVETEDRAPGMLHTAMDTPSEMDPERWQATLG